MQPWAPVAVLGASQHTSGIRDALARLQLRVTTMTSRQALVSPGATLASPLAVFTWPPGRRPPLEAEAYAQGIAALHVSWDAAVAEVGPLVARRLGPCPGCLAASPSPARQGLNPSLGAWACATAALQAHALLHHNTSDLVGTSLRWRLEAPGLVVASWPRRPDCPVPGCAQP